MLDNFDCFGDKLSDESIFSAFLSVVGKLRRGARPEGKVSAAALPEPASPASPQLDCNQVTARPRTDLSVSSSCFFVFLFFENRLYFLERF